MDLFLVHPNGSGIPYANFHQVFNVYMMDMPRNCFQLGNTFPVQDILAMCSNSEATDPKDMIYALQDISREADNQVLKTSYSKSVHQVYTDTTQLLLSQNDPFRILGRAGKVVSKSVAGLPSWVPNWSTIVGIIPP
jgi:hypothetical protein